MKKLMDTLPFRAFFSNYTIKRFEYMKNYLKLFSYIHLYDYYCQAFHELCYSMSKILFADLVINYHLALKIIIQKWNTAFDAKIRRKLLKSLRGYVRGLPRSTMQGVITER